METPLVEIRDGCIRVTGELTIQRAEEIKPLLLASLPTDGSVARLDLSQVSEIDTAGIQLLMAASREVVSRAAVFQVVAVSQVVREALELFRQTGLLEPAGAAS